MPLGVRRREDGRPSESNALAAELLRHGAEVTAGPLLQGRRRAHLDLHAGRPLGERVAEIGAEAQLDLGGPAAAQLEGGVDRPAGRIAGLSLSPR
jgi:hypothetical protein